MPVPSTQSRQRSFSVMAFRSGFVSIIGLPKPGKSTLLNALVGEKVAIVTEKPQTTRTRIQGMLNVKAEPGRPAAQIVFVDTPGVHKPDSRLNRKMMQEIDRKSTRLNSSHIPLSRMPSSA